MTEGGEPFTVLLLLTVLFSSLHSQTNHPLPKATLITTIIIIIIIIHQNITDLYKSFGLHRDRAYSLSPPFIIKSKTIHDNTRVIHI